MHCARCGRAFGVDEYWALAVLPGTHTLRPVCHDDRRCKRPGIGHVLTARIERVRAIAHRYVTKVG